MNIVKFIFIGLYTTFSYAYPSLDFYYNNHQISDNIKIIAKCYAGKYLLDQFLFPELKIHINSKKVGDACTHHDFLEITFKRKQNLIGTCPILIISNRDNSKYSIQFNKLPSQDIYCNVIKINW